MLQAFFLELTLGGALQWSMVTSGLGRGSCKLVVCCVEDFRHTLGNRDLESSGLGPKCLKAWRLRIVRKNTLSSEMLVDS